MGPVASVTVQINNEALRTLLVSPSGPVVKDLTRRGRRVQNQAKRNCPVDVGRLRSSIQMRHVTIGGEPGVEVFTNVEYAMWVHEGTGIYGPRHAPIFPKHGRFLVFTPRGAGSPVFARSVRGMRGRPFLTDALSAAAAN